MKVERRTAMASSRPLIALSRLDPPTRDLKGCKEVIRLPGRSRSLLLERFDLLLVVLEPRRLRLLQVSWKPSRMQEKGV
eukprot:s93_g15.t1